MNLCSAPGNALGICSLSLSLSAAVALALPRTLGDGFLSPVARITTAKLPASQKDPLLPPFHSFFSLKIQTRTRAPVLFVLFSVSFRLSFCLSVSSHGLAFCLHLTYLKKRVFLESPSFFSCLFKCLLSKYSPPPSPRSVSAPLSSVLRCDKRLH